MVQPKTEIDLQFESIKLSTPWGYISAIVLCVATFGTIALMSGFFLKPNATFDDYIADVIPLFGGFLTILGVSEVCFHLIRSLLLFNCNFLLNVNRCMMDIFIILADSHKGNSISLWCQTQPIISCSIQLDRMLGSDEQL